MQWKRWVRTSLFSLFLFHPSPQYHRRESRRNEQLAVLQPRCVLGTIQYIVDYPPHLKCVIKRDILDRDSEIPGLSASWRCVNCEETCNVRYKGRLGNQQQPPPRKLSTKEKSTYIVRGRKNISFHSTLVSTLVLLCRKLPV